MTLKILLPMLAIVAFLAACKGKGGTEEFGAADSTFTHSNADTITATAPKLVKTAEMRFKVKDVKQAGIKIAAVVTSYGGTLVRHQETASGMRTFDIANGADSVIRITSVSTTADITVKIPVAKLEAFMDEVAKQGVMLNIRRMEISDRTLDYLSAKLKLKNRTDLLKQQKQGKIIVRNPANILLLKDDMVDQQIGNRQIDDEVRYSIVDLSFYQSNTLFKETVVNDDPAAYKPPFFKRLAFCLANGWGIFEEALFLLANLWVFIAIAFAIWLMVKRYQRSKVPVLFKT